MRELRQREAVEAWRENNARSIVNGCPRLGKIKISIDIMREEDYKKVLIVYPRTDIKQGWEDDFVKWEWRPSVVVYSTYRSLEGLLNEPFDLIIYDELHEASDAQLEVINKIRPTIPVLGLTGTITGKTEQQIWDSTGIDVCYRYSIDQGVAEGVLCDYDIFIHHIPLDNYHAYKSTAKGKKITEKKAFDNLDYVIKKLRQQRKSTFFLELKKIALIQSSFAKLQFTRGLLAKHHDERVLVFCGVQDIADALDIPSYHSGNKNKEVFNDFCSGQGLHLATIKMMQAGVTVKPINKGIINYTSGNPEDTAQKICRFLGFEYDTPDKKAEIHIICSTESFEIERMRTAMLFFNKEKIHLLNFPYEQEKQNHETKSTTNKRKTGIGGTKRLF